MLFLYLNFAEYRVVSVHVMTFKHSVIIRMASYRSVKRGIKRKKCYSVVRRKTENLADGTTLTTETKDENTVSEHAEAMIVKSFRIGYEKSLKLEMNSVLHTDALSHIRGNPVLSRRLSAILKSHRAFSIWARKNTICTLRDIVEGAAYEDFACDCYFLAHEHFSWNDCLTYANVLHSFQFVRRHTSQTRDSFVHDFIVERFKDKAIMFAFQQNKCTTLYWPECISGIPKSILNVAYGNHDIKVFDGLKFAFMCNDTNSCKLNGLVICPTYMFFPVELLLLVKKYAILYERELASLKNTLSVSSLQLPGVRFQIAHEPQVHEKRR